MGRTDYLIDTNIAIYYFGLALSSDAETFIDHVLEDGYYLSVINRIELLGFSKLQKKEEEALNSLIASAEIIELSEEIVIETIKIRKNYNIKLPDAIIAASCLINHCSLITNNAKDFSKVEGLDLITLN